MRFPASTDRRTIVTRKHTLIYLLVSFCSLFLFISSASAQCKPVVYAFRHAEDKDANLTSVGRQHAALYPSMVDGFGSANNYCPVGFVYSMYDTNPDGKPGTYNPYETAQPLALRACYVYWVALWNNEEVSFDGTFNPDTICTGALGAGNAVTPSMALGNGNKLYEFLEKTKQKNGDPPKQTAATGPQLVAELLSNASAGGSLSSAIFWSSQGLPTLGAAIASGTVLPTKPPRNSVYVFEQQGMAFATTKLTYRQCFNIKVGGSKTPGGTTYWCSAVGNLPTTIENLPLLQGKICDTANLAMGCEVGP